MDTGRIRCVAVRKIGLGEQIAGRVMPAGMECGEEEDESG